MKTLAKKLQKVLALTAVCFFLSITVVTTNAYADEGGERYVDDWGINYILHKGATPDENTATVASPENGKYTKERYSIHEEVSYAGVAYKVVEIEDNAFADCENLVYIYVRNGFLKKIGNNAFFNCTNLTEITIASSRVANFEYIGNNAFYGCKKLKEFEILNNCSLRTIGDQAFYSCSNLQRFYLCAIEKIDFGLCVFGCSPNVQFEMPGTPFDKAYYTVCDGGLYSADMKTLYAYPSAKGTVAIKDGVENIAPSALAHCKDLKKVIFPKSVKSIGKYAFTPMPGYAKKYDFEFKGAKPNIDNQAFDRVTRIDITYDHNYIASWYNSRANLGGAINVKYKMI